MSPWHCLLPILKYMGDYPIKHSRSPIELTDQIFGPATKYVELQDEIYCQIMRQMTTNTSRCSSVATDLVKKLTKLTKTKGEAFNLCFFLALLFLTLQVECRPWVAADVVVHRFVPTRSKTKATRAALPGITAQGPSGCRLHTEVSGFYQVSLSMMCDNWLNNAVYAHLVYLFRKKQQLIFIIS